MSDVQDTPKPWSECSPGELLDMAQHQFNRSLSDYAAVLVAAAHVKALGSLRQTIADKRFI